MYQYLNGEIVEIGDDFLVLDVAGVGYFIKASQFTLNQVNAGMKALIYIKLIVREDAHTLCGFIERRERQFFEHLLRVSGIGPKMAMAMLSNAPYNAILQWIIQADDKQLTRLPGLGKKTAQRLIVELGDRLKKEYGSDVVATESADPLSAADSDEAVLALLGLGFAKDEIKQMLSGVDTTALSVEEVIKIALTKSR